MPGPKLRHAQTCPGRRFCRVGKQQHHANEVPQRLLFELTALLLPCFEGSILYSQVEGPT